MNELFCECWHHAIMSKDERHEKLSSLLLLFTLFLFLFLKNGLMLFSRSTYSSLDRRLNRMWEGGRWRWMRFSRTTSAFGRNTEHFFHGNNSARWTPTASMRFRNRFVRSHPTGTSTSSMNRRGILQDYGISNVIQTWAGLYLIRDGAVGHKGILYNLIQRSFNFSFLRFCKSYLP